MKHLSLTLALAALLCTFYGCSNRNSFNAIESLRTDLASYCDTFDARIGVAVIFDNGDTLTLNNSRQYPLMSVVKCPQAMALCEKMAHEGRSLSDSITLTAADMQPDTWSPLRDDHPTGGTFTLETLLEYMLVKSDNNVCDLFFNTLCSPAETDAYLRSLGIEGCHIRLNESAMHQAPEQSTLNSSTPFAAAQMLEHLYHHREGSLHEVYNTMMQCETGQDRIPKGVANALFEANKNRNTAITKSSQSRIVQYTIIHKTGTSGPSTNGRLLAINDIGIVVLPNGHRFSLAVFVNDIAASPEQAEAVIATIAQMVTVYACTE